MEHQKGGFRSIDEYIATFPEDIQALLEAVRATIKASAPDAEERISYQKLPKKTPQRYNPHRAEIDG